MKMNLIATLLLILLISGGSWLIATSQSGVKPTKPFKPAEYSWKSEFSDFLNPLEKAYLENSKDPAVIKAYSKALETILAVKFIPEVAKELTSVNETLLNLGAEHVSSELLNKQADLYFGIKDFYKAETSYRQLLANDADNHDLRGRLASALSFQGKYDDALSELNSILVKQPDAFQALAYIGITYAQMGQNEKALSFVNQALEKAPSSEARQRLSVFISKLNQEISGSAPAATESEIVTKITEYLKAHEITGPKFVKAEQANDTLKLFFQDFPVEQMPSFAKDKFYKNLKEQVVTNPEIKTIELIDNTTAAVMDDFTV